MLVWLNKLAVFFEPTAFLCSFGSVQNSVLRLVEFFDFLAEFEAFVEQQVILVSVLKVCKLLPLLLVGGLVSNDLLFIGFDPLLEVLVHVEYSTLHLG